MLIGLSGTGQTQCLFLEEVLRGLDFVFAYVNNIFMFSRDEKEHILHLH